MITYLWDSPKLILGWFLKLFLKPETFLFLTFYRNECAPEITGLEDSGSFRSFSRSAEKERWHSWQLRPGCCCSVRCWSGISSEYRHWGEARPLSMSPFLTPLGGVTTYPWSCSSTVWLLLSRLKTHDCNLPDYGSPSLWLTSCCSQVGLTCLGVPITQHRASCITGIW